MHRFGEFCYDPRNRRLARGSETIHATPKSLQLLELLLEARSNLVTLDQINNTVWAGIHIDRTTIHQNVATLRRLLDDDPKTPVFIETVPRLGYRFICPLREEDATGNLKQARIRWSPQVVVPALLAILVGCGFLAVVVFREFGRTETAQRKSARAKYELGRQYWNLRGYGAQSAGARQAFQEAIRIDPRFALWHVGLADAFAVETNLPDPAEHEIRAALALDPNLGEAYASLGFVLMFQRWDWTGSEQAFQRSLKLAPNYATGHQWHGTLLAVVGRLPEARREMERAAALDPLSLPIATDLSAITYFEGRYSDAVNQLERILIRAPAFVFAHRYLISALVQSQRFEAASAEVARYILAATPGQIDYVNALRQNAPNSPAFWQSYCRQPNPYERATCWALAGEQSDALDQLEKALREKNSLLMYAGVEPAFRSLHSSERFQAVLEAMGLGAKQSPH